MANSSSIPHTLGKAWKFESYNPLDDYVQPEPTTPPPSVEAPDPRLRFFHINPLPYCPVSEEDRAEIREMVRNLPDSSFLAQFARGTTFNPPARAYQTKVCVFKGWHAQRENPHFSFSLSWVDGNG